MGALLLAGLAAVAFVVLLPILLLGALMRLVVALVLLPLRLAAAGVGFALGLAGLIVGIVLAGVGILVALLLAGIFLAPPPPPSVRSSFQTARNGRDSAGCSRIPNRHGLRAQAPA